MLGASINVNKNVIIATIQSCFSVFHAFIIGSIFIKSETATIITAAKVTVGK
jgi:hypothetical protein